MRVLAIQYGNHDCSACIYDGEVKNYFLEERYSGKKHDLHHFEIYKNLLRVKDPVDLIVLCYFGDRTFMYDGGLKYLNMFLKAYKKKHGKIPKVIKDKRHHLAHAAGAYYNSGFDKALVMVVDGSGSLDKLSFEAESIYVAEGLKFKEIYKNFIKLFPEQMDLPTELARLKKLHPDAEIHRESMMGLGYLYSAGAVMMGETALQAGKVMGLSSYGNDSNQTHIVKDLFVDDMMFHCREVNLFFYGYGPDNFKDIAQEIFGKKGVNVCDEITKQNYQPYADYAKAVQKDTQNVILRLVRKVLSETGIKKLCFTGGYAMNIITNNLLVETFPDVEFYFEPMATDVGISVGTAMLHWRLNTKDLKPRPLTTTAFHGYKYDLSKFRGLGAGKEEVARLLAESKSVAVYDGYAEAGQRALGNRSILFNPLNPQGRDIVNRIKRREWYRPFAACVLEEDAHLYFDIKVASRFMTQCYKVTTDLIPAVTHVDKTCRVQTVVDGHLYDILQEFKKLTGHGILLNTSFNLAGDPLVETPKQALDTLANSELDYLWFPETLQLFS